MNDQKTTPVKKTPSRGRYMDFAPRRSSAMVVERKKVVRKITITTHADHIDAETQKINEALTRTVKPQKNQSPTSCKTSIQTSTQIQRAHPRRSHNGRA